MAWNTTLVHSCSSCVPQHIDRCLFVSRLCCTFAIVFWARGSCASCLYSFHFTRQVSFPWPGWSQVFIHTFMPLSSHAATHPLLWNAVVLLTTLDLFYYCSRNKMFLFSPFHAAWTQVSWDSSMSKCLRCARRTFHRGGAISAGMNKQVCYTRVS